MTRKAAAKTPTPASTSDTGPDAVEISRRRWERWRYCRRQIRLWTELAQQERDALEAEIGAHSQATIDGVAVISWNEGEKRKKFNMEKFKLQHPDIYAEYEELVPGNRPFTETKGADEIDPQEED